METTTYKDNEKLYSLAISVVQYPLDTDPEKQPLVIANTPSAFSMGIITPRKNYVPSSGILPNGETMLLFPIKRTDVDSNLENIVCYSLHNNLKEAGYISRFMIDHWIRSNIDTANIQPNSKQENGKTTYTHYPINPKVKTKDNWGNDKKYQLLKDSGVVLTLPEAVLLIAENKFLKAEFTSINPSMN
jgi:hypothetical protein